MDSIHPTITLTMDGSVVGYPTCKLMIGLQRQDEETGHWYLRIGGARIETLHGRCGWCGAEFHWTASAVKLEKLIQERLERT
jgi:hypothetical protein